jgi:hypothetical protein
MISIGDGPKLQALGILEPGNHVLNIRGTTVVVLILSSVPLANTPADVIHC